MSLYVNYIEAVRDAVKQQPHEWTFKQDPRYREVLEHTPLEFADAMFNWSIRHLPNLDFELIRSLCDKNDSVGRPIRYALADLGVYSAPSNMRYLCHAIKVWQHVESLNLEEVEILEIGGGYGGLAVWIDGLRSYFTPELLDYTIVDLPEVATLTEKVFRALDMPWSFRAYNEMPPDWWLAPREPWLAVSAYAFSEFTQPLRDYYAERILAHCPHGLMVWNFTEGPLKDTSGYEFGGPPYQFVPWPLTILPDEPALYDGHKVVKW